MLPEDLETELLDYIRKHSLVAEKHCTMHEALEHFLSKPSSIYDNDNRAIIRHDKLLQFSSANYSSSDGRKGDGRKGGKDFSFLFNKANYFGEQVLAHHLHQLRFINYAIKTYNNVKNENEETVTWITQPTSKKGKGGQEVFCMFNKHNNFVLPEILKKAQEIAPSNRKINFKICTNDGKRNVNEPVKDCNKYMEAYFKGKKGKFNATDTKYQDAYGNIEIYLKLMYYVQRGYVKMFRSGNGGEECVNVLWADIGMCYVI